MKIIYIVGATWSGKTTVLKSLCWEENVFFSQDGVRNKQPMVTSVWIDGYRGETLRDDVLQFLKFSWVTHLYIAIEPKDEYNLVTIV